MQWLQWWGWWWRRVTTSRSLSPGSSRSSPSWQQLIANNRSKRATPALLFLPHQRLLRELARPEVGLGNSFFGDQDNLHDEHHDDRRNCWRNLLTALHWLLFRVASSDKAGKQNFFVQTSWPSSPVLLFVICPQHYMTFSHNTFLFRCVIVIKTCGTPEVF